MIGITCGTFSVGSTRRQGVNQAYVVALQQAGAEALLVPPGTSAAVIAGLDGLLLPGGGDLDPHRYGQDPAGASDIDASRDELELCCLEEAGARGLPVLAICRGLQVLNVGRGGTLIQDLPGHRQTGDRGALSHGLSLAAGSRFRELAGVDTLEVNTLHHQAVDRVASGLVVSARAPDGTVEGLETPDGSIVAVQCHPEELTRFAWARRLFADLVRRAAPPPSG